MNDINRRFQWVSSMREENSEKLDILQDQLKKYYSWTNEYYYGFTAEFWTDNKMLVQQDMLRYMQGNKKVLEIGCGRASILSKGLIKQDNYTGIDFSQDLMAINRNNYPGAIFQIINDPKQFAFPSGSFDTVFSHFVIEHCVFPQKILSEKVRLLKKGGVLLLVCPDFLGRHTITSQRTGFSPGSGRVKFKKGRFLDALVTMYDNKVRLPLFCSNVMRRASIEPQFMINTKPRCFTDEFQPDVDAVYVTYAEEIKLFCADAIEWMSNDEEVTNYCRQNNLIYLKGIRK